MSILASDPDEFKIIMYLLSGIYAFLTLIPLFLLIKVQRRDPRVGWTILKLFLVFTLLASLVRAVSFGIFIYLNIENFFLSTQNDTPTFLVLFNVPRVMFFTAFALLILFWAEILQKVNHQEMYRLKYTKTIFIMLNLFVLLVQVIIWITLFIAPDWANSFNLRYIENVFFIVITVFIAVLFFAFGGRLFLKIKSFPIESEGRNKVLFEVGTVTSICFAGFIIRAGFLIAVTVHNVIDNDPVVILLYHVTVEIVPMIALLVILNRPTVDSKDNFEFEDSNSFSAKPENADPVSGSEDKEKSKSGSSQSMPNSKLYYASHPRSYHWARILDSGTLPSVNNVNFAVSFPNTEHATESSQLLWEVDDNYVDNKS